MANDPNTIQYVIQEDGFWYVASKEKNPYVPELTVSAKGVANGLSTEYNDGYDFGPDSYSPTSTSAIPYTETSGIMEAIKFLPLTFYAGADGITYSAPQGTIYMKNGVYKCTSQITLPEGSNIRFIGESPPQPITWFGQGFASLSSPDQYTGGAIIYFPTSVAYPVFHAPANSGHPAEQLYFENIEIRIENPSSYQDATAVDLNGWNMGGCKHFYITSTGASVLSATPMGTGNIDTGCTINASNSGGTYREFDDFRIAGFYNNGLITSIPNANFKSISIACIQSVDSGTGALNVSASALLTIFNYVHLFYCNVGIQYTQSPYTNYYFNMMYFESTNTPLIATMTGGAADYYLPIPINAVLFTNVDTSGNIVNQYTGDIADKSKVRILSGVQLLNHVSEDSPVSPDWINNGTTAGTINGQIVEWTQNYKKILIYFDGYENDTTTDQTLTFPNAFNVANAVTANTTGLTISVSTTGITITAPDSTTTYSGIVIVEGY